MSENENSVAPQCSSAEEIEFWLEQKLGADEIFDCLQTSKGKHLLEGSRTSVTEIVKNVLTVLVRKHTKLVVASRELEVATSEREVACRAVETYRMENVRLLGESAGFQATNRVLRDEIEKAVKGAPVGLPGPTSKARPRSTSRSKSERPGAQKKPKTKSNPEKKAGYLDGVCETVLERLGQCTRGEGGGLCPLLHPQDCTKPACHAKGGRQATNCDGWHLFKKYSELKAERKENAKATKARKAAERKAAAIGQRSTSGKPAKGNCGPGKKAASPGQQQRFVKQRPAPCKKTLHNDKGSQVPRVPQPQGQYQQQVYPPGHQEWAASRQPMAYYSQAVPQHGYQAAPTVPVYNTFQPLASQGASGF